MPLFVTLTVKVCVWPADQFCGIDERSRLDAQTEGVAASDTGVQSLNQNCCSFTISASSTGAATDGAAAVTFQVTLVPGGTSDGRLTR